MKAVVLIVDDEEAVRRVYRRQLVRDGYDVADAGTLALAREALSGRRFDAVLLDLNLPDGNGLDLVEEVRRSSPAAALVVVSGMGELATAVEAMRRGADNYLQKPVDMEALLVFLKKAVEMGTMRRGQLSRRRTVKLLEPHFGEAPAMRAVMELAQTASQNDVTVVIQGETGVGKGVLARWIHEHSPRAAAPFVEVNCSSLRGELLSSELFGHIRGAFTSAVEDRQGLIEVADGGTLFLDEIGDMDVGVQAQFLKVIEEKRYRRLGDVRVRSSEFRLLCATNQRLEDRVEQGFFRSDLFFRINVFPVRLPALRDVPETIPGLVRSLLAFLSPREIQIEPAVFDLLARYPWPGNVRELRNVIERALVLGGQTLSPSHFQLLALAPFGAASAPTQAAAPSSIPTANANLADMELARINEIVAQCQGDTKKAAELLGISRATLYRRIGPRKPAQA